MRGLLRLLIITGLTLGVASCKTASPQGPYAPMSSQARNPLKAQELTLKAADLVFTDPHAAEQLLREALTADLHYGPAHNNLGVIYLERGMLYEASCEFEWARKLLPGHPDPRMNLAMTLERAGRIDDAIAAYNAALEVYTDHLPTQQALVRCQLRHGHADERTHGLLERVALCGDTEEWRIWARQQLTRVQN